MRRPCGLRFVLLTHKGWMLMMRWNACSVLVALVLSAALAGCGSEQSSRATVKGQVTIDSKPLTYGTVTFIAKDNRRGSSSIDASGNYTVTDAPLGEVAVTVWVPEKSKMPIGKGIAAPKGVPLADPQGGQSLGTSQGMDPSKIVPIPGKYANPTTSGLTYNVERGDQKHDIALTK
jgi:hypothetical protein